MSYGTSVTQCPKCNAVGTYKVTTQNGSQIVHCNSCRKTFSAEVKQGVFTGRNR
jgi:hypothetical protein